MNHRDLVSNYIQRPKGARLSNLRAGNNQLSVEGIHLVMLSGAMVSR